PNSPPAILILLRESYREDGKVRKRILCNLSDWPAATIEGLRGVLKGGTVIAAERDAFTVIRSLPHGHVVAALGTGRRIGLDRILGPEGNRCRDLILALLSSDIRNWTRPLKAGRHWRWWSRSEADPGKARQPLEAGRGREGRRPASAWISSLRHGT
ncbi:MAG: hypothetical protein ACREFO_20235, partial [Acetobacteraceae bacterium]